jgi:ATP-dependent helicase/nuclease subunit A
MIPNDATLAQVAAADPTVSTWLSANAGSGKTRVLTDRVARLLLNGVYPQHILCLTYTKAAASEMQNRLFQRLGEWAMLADAALQKQLLDLGHQEALSPDALRQARRLFARAIETPGGLKIQTIHSFCSSLLRRFPLEAGVTPQFVEMDERAADTLRAEILDDIAESADCGVLDAVLATGTGDLTKLTGEIVQKRGHFGVARSVDEILRTFDLNPGTGPDDILAEVFLGDEGAWLPSVISQMSAGSKTDAANATKLSAVLPRLHSLETLQVFEKLFLTGKDTKSPFSAKIGSIPTKGTQKSMGPELDKLNDLMARVEGARERRLALIAAQRAIALNDFAAVFLPRYDARKQAHGWLDFDDLILKARDLLTDPGVAEWVLFRLDGGLDHVLVDEAQDTSPEQWQVVDLLTQEFTAGAGARSDVERTLFVVGDRKQSIYSFQGADPDKFNHMQAQFAARLEAVEKTLFNRKLEYSFRSSYAVLSAVDHTFHEGARHGVGDDFLHRAFHDQMPGRVDVWPVVEPNKGTKDSDWTDPVDLLSEEHHAIQLAQQIATEIKRMIDAGVTLKNGGKVRPVSAGDFLILVQRRSDLFHEVIRACKNMNLPIAGADRLKIGGELAVKDLNALMSFLALPEDDLSLACALRSPLFGWDEGRIFDLAAGRKQKFLWPELRDRQAEFPETFAILDALLRDADFLRPYDLIERILTRFKGRQNLITRLGEEAEDGIDALLNQALAYERTDVPSLTGFLVWLASGEVTIKRQLDNAGDRIRVMTVHGAKGLEAPIVILPDTIKQRRGPQDRVYIAADGTPLSAGADAPAVLRDAADVLKSKAEEEAQRLLYVAMTRAEQWLIVCGAGKLGNESDHQWYARMTDGVTRAGGVPFEFAGGQGLRLEHGDWPEPVGAGPVATQTTADTLPPWAIDPVKTPDRPAQTMKPSDLGGAKVVFGPMDDDALSQEDAMERGTRIHLLLEHLPKVDPANWTDLTARLLPALDDPTRDEILNAARGVLTHPDIAPVFARPALCEVDITASLPALNGARIFGTIDRLIVEPDRVLAIDYKTNAHIPDTAAQVPTGILRQMGAYHAALSQIYPEKTVDTAILWTAGPVLMPLSSQMIAAALGQTATS